MDRLSSALRVTREPSIPLSLHTVCTNLTSNTLTVAGSRQWWESPICVLLKAWVEELEEWNVQVLTRVYEAVLDDPRQVPLAQVFNAARISSSGHLAWVAVRILTVGLHLRARRGATQ